MVDVINRAITAWAHDSYAGVMLPAMGATSCSTMRNALAALKAENETLIAAAKIAAEQWDFQKSRAEAAERALAERAGGVKVSDKPTIRAVFECSENGIIGSTEAKVKRVEEEDDGSFTVVIDHWPVSERQQDNEPRAYIVHAPEDDYYGTGPDRLQFHPLAQHDIDNGYRQTPLYGRPVKQAVTEAIVDAVVKVVQPYTRTHLFMDELQIIVRTAINNVMEKSDEQ